MVITLNNVIKKIILILFSIYLLLQYNTEIYFRRTTGEASAISFEWQFSEYRPSCAYQWHQYQFYVPSCVDLEIGGNYHLIGRVVYDSDKTVFNPKKLAIQSIKQLELPADSDNSKLAVIITSLEKSRQAFLEWLLNVFKTPDQIIMAAILTGNKTRVPDDQRHQIEVTGMQHAFAVSGQHLSIMLGSLQPISRRFWGRYAGVPLVIMAWILSWIVGSSASMVRAALMVTISLLVSRWWHRSISSTQLLLQVVVIMLLINPWWLFDIGFQLTLAAMIGVILSQQLLTTKNKQNELEAYWMGNFSLTESDSKHHQRLNAKIARYIRETVVVTIIITLCVGPLTLWYFQSLSLIAVVANVVLLWIFPLLLATAVASALCYSLIYLVPNLIMVLTPVFWILERPTAFTMSVLAWLAQFESFFIQNKEVSGEFILIYYIVFFSIWRLFVHQTKRAYQIKY